MADWPGKPTMFEAHAKETPWEWAGSRRVLFTSTPKDLLSGLVVGSVGGWYRYEAGDANWRIAVGVAVLTVCSAFFLPQLETLFWLARRSSILLDESRDALALVRARERGGEAGVRAAASTEDVLKRLGNLRLRYIELERAFLREGGRESLWHAQTALHNEALAIIDRELGRDYWAQFKDVKLAPLVIPSGFPSDDAERLNLLYIIHGRSEWISRVLDRIRSGQVVPKPVSVATAPPESQRLKDMRRILRDAAEYVRAMPSGRGNTHDAVVAAVVTHETVPELLTRGFIMPPTNDYMAYLEAEKQKRREDYNMRDASADFLIRLADLIREDNLDQGFLMPQSWLQFRESDPSRNWPTNTR